MFPKGKTDGLGFQSGRYNLIQKRLKWVVVVLVYENSLKQFVVKFVDQSQSAKTAPTITTRFFVVEGI